MSKTAICTKTRHFNLRYMDKPYNSGRRVHCGQKSSRKLQISSCFLFIFVSEGFL